MKSAGESKDRRSEPRRKAINETMITVDNGYNVVVKGVEASRSRRPPGTGRGVDVPAAFSVLVSGVSVAAVGVLMIVAVCA